MATSLREAIKNAAAKQPLPEDTLSRLTDAMVANWFDSAAIVATARIKDLEDMSVPTDFAAVLISEAEKIANATEPARDNWWTDSYKPKKSKRDAEVEIVKVVGPQLPEPGDPPHSFLRQFIAGEANPEARKKSLKKLKFVLSKILDFPDMKEWRVVDPSNPDMARLIIRYESLCNLLSFLGFEATKKGTWELRSGKVNISLLQEALQAVNELREESGVAGTAAPLTGTQGVGPVSEWQEQLHAAYEVLTVTYKDYLFPRVRVLRTDADRQAALTQRIKIFDGMVDWRKRKIRDKEARKDELGSQLATMETFMDAKDVTKTREKVERLSMEIATLEHEISRLQKLCQAVPLHATMRGESELGSDRIPEGTRDNNRAFYAAQLLEKTGENDFPPEPATDDKQQEELEKLTGEFEEFEQQVRLFIGEPRVLGPVFTKLECYARQDRTVVSVTEDGVGLLEIDLSKGEEVGILFKLIGLKLGLNQDSYDLSLKGTTSGLRALEKSLLKDLSVDYFEELELRMRPVTDWGTKWVSEGDLD